MKSQKRIIFLEGFVLKKDYLLVIFMLLLFIKKDKEFHKANKIKFFFDCSMKKNNFKLPIKKNNSNIHKKIAQNDSNKKFIRNIFSKILPEFLEFEKLAELKDQSILIFCKDGQNRSLCLLICYLMHKYYWCFFKSLEFIDSKRANIEIQKSLFAILKKLCLNYEKDKGFSQNWFDDFKSIIELRDEEEILRNTFLNTNIQNQFTDVNTSNEVQQLLLNNFKQTQPRQMLYKTSKNFFDFQKESLKKIKVKKVKWKDQIKSKIKKRPQSNKVVSKNKKHNKQKNYNKKDLIFQNIDMNLFLGQKKEKKKQNKLLQNNFLTQQKFYQNNLKDVYKKMYEQKLKSNVQNSKDSQKIEESTKMEERNSCNISTNNQLGLEQQKFIIKNFSNREINLQPNIFQIQEKKKEKVSQNFTQIFCQQKLKKLLEKDKKSNKISKQLKKISGLKIADKNSKRKQNNNKLVIQRPSSLPIQKENIEKKKMAQNLIQQLQFGFINKRKSKKPQKIFQYKRINQLYQQQFKLLQI